MKAGAKCSRQHVASGNYVVSQRGDSFLEAYLGSCVGITLCDRDAGLGGLMHLLLPSPTEMSSPWKAEIYATTGMPLFIQAMVEAGASKECMEACVAGGALVGPVSKKDLDLDIGGRTAEIVHRALNREGIPIREEETGGYFSCKLRLDLRTLETSIDPIVRNISGVEKRVEKPTSEEIGQAVCFVRPIPQVALKIARMIQAGDYKMDEVAREIKQDQVIGAKVIKLSNSAFLGLKRRIDSIDRALVIMGEKVLLQMVISASLEVYFSQIGNGYSLCKGGLFKHALGTALVASELSKYTGISSPEIAYTAGLLHDIGKVVLDQYITSVYPFFYRKTQIGVNELVHWERDKLGISHTEAGELLAKRWSMPQNLTDVIRHHHYPERAEVDTGLTHLIYFADLIMSRFHVGQELECINMDDFASRLKEIGLQSSQFTTLIERIPSKIFEVSAYNDGMQ
jgi:putative nucleotidyltransferase with HDIG domain